MKTLEQILEYEKKHRCEKGPFGINACKESIRADIEWDEKLGKKFSLYKYLEECVQKANESPLFNKAMVLACWELINNK